jgi:hypothetical protein
MIRLVTKENTSTWMKGWLMRSSDKYVQIADTSEGGRVARKVAQLISREKL